MSNGKPFIEIKYKRAKDLTDRDVIRLSRNPEYRFEDGHLVRLGKDRAAGPWRET